MARAWRGEPDHLAHAKADVWRCLGSGPSGVPARGRLMGITNLMNKEHLTLLLFINISIHLQHGGVGGGGGLCGTMRHTYKCKYTHTCTGACVCAG